jgi:fido (protein-threonine AMPylation protein)
MLAVNAALPFRAGNGRSQRALLRKPARAATQARQIKRAENQQESKKILKRT